MSKTILDGGVNPIFNFITPPGSEQVQPAQSSGTSPRSDYGMVKRSSKVNRQTKRLNLLIQPSLHESLAKIACIKQTSVNAVIIEASKEYCAKEARALEKYERTFGKEAEEV